MAITADNYAQYLANYTPSADVSSGKAAPVRSPGNWATHLLPVVGSILGGLAGGIPGAAVGGGLSKALENKFEHQSLGNGVVGQGVLGGVSEGVGGLVAPLISKVAGGAGSLISNLVGKEGTEAATNAAVDTAAQAPSRAADLVPGSKSSFLDSILSRFKTPEAPIVSQGTGAVEVGQGGNIVSVGDKAPPLTPTQHARKVLSMLGKATPDNAIYNTGLDWTTRANNLEKLLPASANVSEDAHAIQMVLDNLTPGGSSLANIRDIHKAIDPINELSKDILARSDGTIPASDIHTAFDKLPQDALNIKVPGENATSAEILNHNTLTTTPGTEHYQAQNAVDKLKSIASKYDSGGVVNATNVDALQRDVAGMIQPAQWRTIRGLEGGQPLDTADKVYLSAWKDLGDKLGEVAPELKSVKKMQSLFRDAIPALQDNIASKGNLGITLHGTARGGVPGSQSLIQNIQNAGGRALQGFGGDIPKLIESSKELVPQILGHNIGATMDKEAAQAANEKAAQDSPDLGSAGSDVKATLGTTHEKNQLGITPEQIKQAELTDLTTTGGKNYSQLSKLGTIVNAMDKSQTLSPAGENDLGAYQNTLQALQGINDVFTSGASSDQVATALATALPYLTKATGLSATEIKKLLPSPTEKQKVVNQKLSDIKTLIDSKANESLQSQLSKNSPDTNSLVGSLVGA